MEIDRLKVGDPLFIKAVPELVDPIFGTDPFLEVNPRSGITTVASITWISVIIDSLPNGENEKYVLRRGNRLRAVTRKELLLLSSRPTRRVG